MYALMCAEYIPHCVCCLYVSARTPCFLHPPSTDQHFETPNPFPALLPSFGCPELVPLRGGCPWDPRAVLWCTLLTGLKVGSSFCSSSLSSDWHSLYLSPKRPAYSWKVSTMADTACSKGRAILPAERWGDPSELHKSAPKVSLWVLLVPLLSSLHAALLAQAAPSLRNPPGHICLSRYSYLGGGLSAPSPTHSGMSY